MLVALAYNMKSGNPKLYRFQRIESAFLRAFKPAVERAMLNQDATPVPDLPLNHLPPRDVGIDTFEPQEG